MPITERNIFHRTTQIISRLWCVRSQPFGQSCSTANLMKYEGNYVFAAKRKPIVPGAFLRMKSVCLFISCTFSFCRGSPLRIYYSYVCFFVACNYLLTNTLPECWFWFLYLPFLSSPWKKLLHVAVQGEYKKGDWGKGKSILSVIPDLPSFRINLFSLVFSPCVIIMLK